MLLLNCIAQHTDRYFYHLSTAIIFSQVRLNNKRTTPYDAIQFNSTLTIKLNGNILK